MNKMNTQELRAVARSLAYGFYECTPYLNQLASNTDTALDHIIESMFRNQASEFWHCLNRKKYVEGPHVDLRIVHNSDVDKAIANTLAWLKWYQLGGHRYVLDVPKEGRIPMPEWGKEYV